MSYAFVGVHGCKGLVVSCYECGRRVAMPKTWADLLGPAYRAYYCQPCALDYVHTEES